MRRIIKLSNRLPRPTVLIGCLALTGTLLWCYSSAMRDLAHRWLEPDYQHGFLVPVFAVVLLWLHRGMLQSLDRKPRLWSSVIGVSLLLVAAGMRWASAYFYYGLVDPLSLIPCLGGLVLLIGGWGLARWAWPSIAFLVFMIPLPGMLAGILSRQLQRVATVLSVYVIQTLGIPSFARGNEIVLSSGSIGVAEVCSGLRMMILFLAVCVGVALVVRRNRIEKAIIVLSAAPIAVLVNVFRITLTAVLRETVGEGLAGLVFHDLAGWLMMPLAVILLWIELALLSRLFVESAPRGPIALQPGESRDSPRERPAKPRRQHAGV